MIAEHVHGESAEGAWAAGITGVEGYPQPPPEQDSVVFWGEGNTYSFGAPLVRSLPTVAPLGWNLSMAFGPSFPP